MVKSFLVLTATIIRGPILFYRASNQHTYWSGGGDGGGSSGGDSGGGGGGDSGGGSGVFTR